MITKPKQKLPFKTAKIVIFSALFLALGGGFFVPKNALAFNTYAAKDIIFNLSVANNFYRTSSDGSITIPVTLTLNGPDSLFVQSGLNGDQLRRGLVAGIGDPIHGVGVGAALKDQVNSICGDASSVLGSVTGSVYNCKFPYTTSEWPNVVTAFFGSTWSKGQQLTFNVNLSSSDIANLKLNASDQGTVNEVYIYPYFDLALFPNVAFSPAKSVFVQVYNTQAQVTQHQNDPAAVDANGNPIPGNGSVLTSPNQNPGTGLIGFLNELLGLLVGAVNQLIFVLFSYIVVPFIIALLSIHTYSDAFVNVIYPGWQIIRNLGNIIFIVALMAIAIGTLIRNTSYQLKSLIVQLVIAALLVNFSLVIGQAVLGVADTVQNQFLPNNEQVIKNLGDNMMTKTISTLRTNWTPQVQGSFSTTVTLIVFLAMALGTLGVFIAIAAYLIIRIVMLWVLLMLSPVAYIAGILPVTKKYRSLWWGMFVRYAFFTAIIAIFLNIAGLMSDVLIKNNVLQSVSSATFDKDSSFPTLTAFVFKFLSNVLLMLFLFFTLRSASLMGIKIGSSVTDAAEKGMFSPFRYIGGKVGNVGERLKTGADTRRLELANKLRPSESDSALRSMSKRVGFGVLAPGTVSDAKKQNRSDALHNAEHQSKTIGKAFAAPVEQQERILKKLDQEHRNQEAKKAKEAYSDSTPPELVDSFRRASHMSDDHSKAVELQAIIETAIKEGSFKDLRDGLGVSKIEDFYDLLHNNGLHDPDINRIGNIVNREMDSKNRYQDVVKATVGAVPGAPTKFTNLTPAELAQAQEARDTKIGDMTPTEKATKLHSMVFVNKVGTTVTGVTSSAADFATDFISTGTSENIISNMKTPMKNDLRSVLTTPAMREQFRNGIMDKLHGGHNFGAGSEQYNQAEGYLSRMDTALNPQNQAANNQNATGEMPFGF